MKRGSLLSIFRSTARSAWSFSGHQRNRLRRRSASVDVQMLENRALLSSITLSTAQNALGAGGNQGWWSNGAAHDPGNSNYFTGFSGGPEYRSFFSFSLAGLPANAKVTAATLNISQGTSGTTHSGPLPASLQIFDVSTSAATLKQSPGSNSAIFTDLGTGTSYGTMSVSTPSYGAVFSAALNSAGVQAVDNEASSYFSVGLKLSQQAATHYTFSGTGLGGTQQLVLTYVQPPSDLTLTSAVVAESLATGGTVGTLAAIDPDGNAGTVYSLVSGTGSDDNSSFMISGNSLETNVALDFESKSSYAVRLRATDVSGLTYDKSFTISVTNVNETPIDLALSASTVEENQALETVVGALSTTDPDASNTFMYTFVSGDGDTDNSAFTIDGDSLKASTFNFEAQSSYSVRIRSTDQGGLSVDNSLTISVTNVNETPIDLALSASTVEENQALGTVVGALSTMDPDASNTFTYTLVSGDGDTDNGAFTIDGDLLHASTFNFEAQSSYSVRIRSTDQEGLSVDNSFTISVTNVNETPIDLALSASTVAENQALGTVVGALSTTDPDASNTFTYTLVSGDGDTDNGAFTIDGNSLKASTFNFEAKSSYSVRVRSTDQGGLAFEKVFVVTVTNVNESPTGLTLSAASIAENLVIGTTVGTFSATDPDASNTFVYSLVAGTGSTDNAAFSIAGNVLKTAALLDFEVKPTRSIRVRATDQGGHFFEHIFTINIVNSLDGTAGSDSFVVTYSATGVLITLSVAGGPVVSQGVFPLNSPVTIPGLTSIDSVRVIATSGNDVINVFASYIEVNAAKVFVNGPASRVIAGGAGNDTYRFDADAFIGAVVLDESLSGVDVLDFSTTTTREITIDIGASVTQFVNSMLSLKLGSGLQFESIIGGSGNDTLTGNSLPNILTANAGNDVLNGGPGSDNLIGGVGSDRYVFGIAGVGGELDTITEASSLDQDTLDFSSRTVAVTVNISDSVNLQQVHTDRKIKLSSGVGIEIVLGGSGDDTITGNASNNVLVGNGGKDRLTGSSGRDILIGGLGLDTLSGGDDEDILISGRTAHDASPVSLGALLSGWSSSSAYATRAAALKAGVGSPVVATKPKTTVLNDSGEKDVLAGGLNTDWYFKAIDEVISDLLGVEIVELI